MAQIHTAWEVTYEGGKTVFLRFLPTQEVVVFSNGRPLTIGELLRVCSDLRDEIIHITDTPVCYYIPTYTDRTSGAREIFLRPLGNYKGAHVHISMYQKLNEGFRVPYEAFGAVLEVLQDMYERDIPTDFQYQIKKVQLAVYSNIYLGLPASFYSRLYEYEEI